MTGSAIRVLDVVFWSWREKPQGWVRGGEGSGLPSDLRLADDGERSEVSLDMKGVDRFGKLVKGA